VRVFGRRVAISLWNYAVSRTYEKTEAPSPSPTKAGEGSPHPRPFPHEDVAKREITLRRWPMQVNSLQ
jgi:hypothetical protein